jgi:hypothetical protein
MVTRKNILALVFAGAVAAFSVAPSFAMDNPAMAIERSLIGTWECEIDYAATDKNEAFVELANLEFNRQGYFSGSSIYVVGSEYFGLSYAGTYSYDDPSFTLTRQITSTDPKITDDNGNPFVFPEETFSLEFTDLEEGERFVSSGEDYSMVCLRTER